MLRLIHLWIKCCTFLLLVLASVVSQSHSELYAAALVAIREGNLVLAVDYLERALPLASETSAVDNLQLLGTIYLKLDNVGRALELLENAVGLDEWREPVIVSNYIEALRASKQLRRAIEVGQKAIAMHPLSAPLHFNFACAVYDADDGVSYYNILLLYLLILMIQN